MAARVTLTNPALSQHCYAPTIAAGFIFENSTSLWLCDNGATAEWHVWHMTVVSGLWTLRRTVKWATTDPGYSITGRYETLAGGQSSWVIYSVTYSVPVASLGALWRFEAATGAGTTAALVTNARPNTKWRSVALPPWDELANQEPPPPPVPNITATLEERSPPGTSIGAPLGASLNTPYPVSFELLTGHRNVSGNGLVNVTGFSISQCGGQVTVAANVLDWYSAQQHVLTVKTTIDDPEFFPRLFSVTTVIILVTRVPRPPQVPDPALNATTSESAAAGTAIGALQYFDRENRAAGNFSFSLDQSPSVPTGLFAINSQGQLTVGPGPTAMDFESGNVSFAVSFTMTDRSAPSQISRGRAIVRVIDGPDAPRVVPGQLVPFSETATVGSVALAQVNTTDQDAPTSAFFAPPTFSLVPASQAAATCGSPAPQARLPTTDSSAGAPPLFTIASGSGVMSLINAPLTPWGTNLTVFSGSFVRAVWAVCVSVRDAYSATTSAYVYVVIASSESATGSRPLVSSWVVTGNGGTPAQIIGGEAVLAPEGGSEMRLTGSGFGTAIVNPAGSYMLALSPGNGGFTCNASCIVLGGGSLLVCTAPSGAGARLMGVLSLRGAPVLSSAAIIVSYAPAIITSIADEAAALSLPTTGLPARTVVLYGSGFVDNALRFLVRVTFGRSGTEFDCAVVDVSTTQVSCVPGEGSGTGLNVSVSTGGQQALMQAPQPIHFGYARATIAGVTPVSAGASISLLDTRGSQQLSINGSNFGTGSSLVLLILSAPRLTLTSTTPCTHSFTSPHTQVVCSTPAGVGANMSVSLVVAGQESQSAPSLVSYSRPRVVRVVTAGASSTAGGTQFSVMAAPGEGWGPSSLGTSIDFVRYSKNTTLLRQAAAAGGALTGVFDAADCRALSDAELLCAMSPGCGAGHALHVSVGGQAAPVYPAELAYAPPQLSSFSGPGANGAATLGGQRVDLVGDNLGDGSAYVSSRLRVSFTAAAGYGAGRRSWTFSPSACNITVPHRTLSCNMPAGAGRDLQWSVQLDGLDSTQPFTSYEAPVVTRITGTDGITPITAAPARGGAPVIVTGVGFGPAQVAGNGSLVTSLSFGPTGIEYRVASVTVVSDSRIQFLLPPGTGSALTLRLTVAGQENAGSPTMSYARPAITLVTPARGPTQPTGNGLVTLRTTNVPLLDSAITPLVRFGAGAAAVTLPPYLPAANATDPLNVTFALPGVGGVGRNVPVYVVSMRGSEEASASLAARFSFDDPLISGAVATRFVGSNASARCPLPVSSGALSCSDPSLVFVSLVGTNFGPATWSDGVGRVVELAFTDESSGETLRESARWGSQPQSTGSGRFYLVSWGHTRVTLLTLAARANVTLQLQSPSWDGSIPSNQTARASYVRMSPTIMRAFGATSNVPTVGGAATSPLMLHASGLGPAAWVQVAVGGTLCPLLRVVSGACTAQLVAPDAVDTTLPAAIASQVLSTAAQGARGDDVSLLCCVPPEGQGAGLPIQLLTYASTTDNEPARSDPGAGAQLSYAPPTLSSLQLDGGDETPLAPGARGLTLRIPTAPVILRVRGANLGPSPRLFAGDVVASADDDGVTGVACANGTAAQHSCYEFVTPAGEGDGLGLGVPAYTGLGGFPFYLSAGGQASTTYAMRYRAPNVTSIAPQAAGEGIPTRGGTRVVIRGSNFGSTPPVRVAQLVAVLFRGSSAPQWNVTLQSCVRLSHEAIECTLPAGSGASLGLAVTVAGQTGTKEPALSYDLPVIDEVTTLTRLLERGGALPSEAVSAITAHGNSTSNGTTASPPPDTPLAGLLASGPTRGGVLIVVSGSNFGPGDASVPAQSVGGNCVFMSWARRPASNAALVHRCNSQEDWVGEGELPASHIVYWNHELAVFRTPPGGGLKDVILCARGSLTTFTANTTAPPRFAYAPPRIDAIVPSSGASTGGGTLISIRGDNFGAASLNTSDANLRQLSPGFGEAGFAVPLELAPGLPAAFTLVRVGGRCLSNARDAVGGTTLGVLSFFQACLSTAFPLVRHTHDEIVFVMPPGVGVNKSVRVEIAAAQLDYASSNVVNVSYAPPEVALVLPNPVRLRGGPVELTLRGRNFGPIDDAGLEDLTPEERSLAVVVGGSVACADALRVLDDTGVALQCTLPQDARAGTRNLTLTVAGQTAVVPAARTTLSSGAILQPLVIGCDAGFFGRTGETCARCPPVGAVCAGYNESIAPSTLNGVLQEPLDAQHTYPVPQQGYFSLVRAAVPDAREPSGFRLLDMGAACPPLIRAQYPGRDVCVVPCEPAEACTGGNVCATGYTSLPPMYRCASCDKGFFKRAGVCVRCPDSPAALFVGFIGVVMLIACAGYLLNKRQVNIAVASIAIDYFQVLAIFAQARVAWPPAVRELLHVLSAFNLNIEIVAPECLIPDVSFKQKFAYVLILPVSLAALLCGLFVGSAVWKTLILRRPSKSMWAGMPTLVSSLLVLTYVMYIYITKTLLEVFSCTPTTPPDGKRYLQVRGRDTRCRMAISMGSCTTAAVDASILAPTCYP